MKANIRLPGVKVKGRGIIRTPEGKISVSDGRGGSLFLTEAEYRTWCREKGRSCPIGE